MGSSLILTVQAWEEFPTDTISTESISAVLHDSKNLPSDTAGVQLFDAATSGRAGFAVPGAVSRLDVLHHSHLVCAPCCFSPIGSWDPNTITLCPALSCSRKPVDCNALLLQCCLIAWLVCWFCFCKHLWPALMLSVWVYCMGGM